MRMLVKNMETLTQPLSPPETGLLQPQNGMKLRVLKALRIFLNDKIAQILAYYSLHSSQPH